MEQFSKLGPLQALIKLWSELTPPQRVIVTTFAALAVGLLVFGVSNLSKPKMVTLYSNLSPEDAGAISQKLTELKVDYEPANGGTTILVPESKRDEMLIQLASQGLPQGGTVGFETFDKSSFGMTEFMEKVKFTEAIQGELQRTICSLAPVINARVHVTMPQDNIYQSEQEPAKAGVLLKLRRGQPLNDEQVSGIVRLVSSAVEGLKPENVNVTDTDGNVLAEGQAMASGGGLMTSNQSKLKRQYEAELAQNLQSMLAKTLGPDKAVVRVSAELGFDQVQEKKEVYTPAIPEVKDATGKIIKEGKGLLLNQQQTTEHYKGAVIPPGNLQAPAGSNGKNTGPNDVYDKTDTTAQYGVTKTISETVTAPGTVKRLSVAVMVDDKVSPAMLGSIQEAVRAAAGIDDKRSDVLTVSRIKFDQTAKNNAKDEMDKAEKSASMMAIAKNVGAVVLLAAFLFFLTRIIKQIKVPTQEVVVTQVVEGPPQEKVIAPGDLIAAIDNSHAQAAAQEPYVPPKQENLVPPEVANSTPEDLARLVRSWMSEQ